MPRYIPIDNLAHCAEREKEKTKTRFYSPHHGHDQTSPEGRTTLVIQTKFFGQAAPELIVESVVAAIGLGA